MSNWNSRKKFEIWILATYLVAFDTLGGKLVFITLGTINVMFFGDEGFCANWIVACATNETFFVPLSSLVFHFLHSCKNEIVKMFHFLKFVFIHFVYFSSILFPAFQSHHFDGKVEKTILYKCPLKLSFCLGKIEDTSLNRKCR